MAGLEINPYAGRGASFLLEEEEETQDNVFARPPADPAPVQPTKTNPYAGKARRFKQADTRPAIQAVIANVGISPDEYKGAKAIAKDVGVHARMLIDGTVDQGQARSQQLIS